MARSVTNQITRLLFERCMTQKELAQKSGLTESAISHYVRGDRVPRGVNLVKIAKALETTTDYLLSEGEQEINQSEKKKDLEVVRTLIARNASQMSKEEKMELVGILISGE